MNFSIHQILLAKITVFRMAIREKRIEQKLTVLKPHYLEIINDSDLHLGHEESKDGVDTHFTIKIAAEKFNGLTKIKQHKIINDLLKDEFHSGLHALSIRIIDKKELL
jgi:BolA protein